jgi:hypothetical protein
MAIQWQECRRVPEDLFGDEMAQPDHATRTAPPEPAAIPIEQAVYRRPPGAAPALLARSPGFAEEWLPAVNDLLTGFGERPPGVACPAAVFARPLGKEHVAIVQVADLDDERREDPPLGFRVLVLLRRPYVSYLGDPFAIADRFPPPWPSAGLLENLSMPAESLPARTVADVQRVLKRVKAHALREDEEPPTFAEDPERAVAVAESPALLGGVQVLVDGGRVMFERPGPDTELMRGLWTLLPTQTRCELWPASFAFDNALGFDALIVPAGLGAHYEGYTNEDQAAEYPQGSYELRLQIAAEAGDQQELDVLFARRSFREMWKLGLTMLIGLAILVGVLRLTAPAPVEPRRELTPQPAPRRELSPAERAERAGVATGIVSSGSPWEALNLLHIGMKKWSSSGRAAP